MDRLEQLKQKYGAAIQVITQEGVSLKNLHVQDDKLFIRGAAPTEQARNAVWTAVKTVDSTLADVNLDVTVDSSLPVPKREQSYTVAAGDSLSKISKQFYGDANHYMKIFEANTDQLKNPDAIKVGQVLRIPAV